MPCAQGETRTHRGGRNNLSEVRERARSFISKQHEMMDRVYFSSALIYHSLTYMVLTELLSVPLLQNLLTLLRWMDWRVHGTHALNPWSGWPRQPSHSPSEPQSVIISYISFCVKNGKHAWIQCALAPKSLTRPPTQSGKVLLLVPRAAGACPVTDVSCTQLVCILHQIVGLPLWLTVPAQFLAHEGLS